MRQPCEYWLNLFSSSYDLEKLKFWSFSHEANWIAYKNLCFHRRKSQDNLFYQKKIQNFFKAILINILRRQLRIFCRCQHSRRIKRLIWKKFWRRKFEILEHDQSFKNFSYWKTSFLVLWVSKKFNPANLFLLKKNIPSREWCEECHGIKHFSKLLWARKRCAGIFESLRVRWRWNTLLILVSSIKFLFSGHLAFALKTLCHFSFEIFHEKKVWSIFFWEKWIVIIFSSFNRENFQSRSDKNFFLAFFY